MTYLEFEKRCLMNLSAQHKSIKGWLRIKTAFRHDQAKFKDIRVRLVADKSGRLPASFTEKQTDCELWIIELVRILNNLRRCPDVKLPVDDLLADLNRRYGGLINANHQRQGVGYVKHEPIQNECVAQLDKELRRHIGSFDHTGASDDDLITFKEHVKRTLKDLEHCRFEANMFITEANFNEVITELVFLEWDEGSQTVSANDLKRRFDVREIEFNTLGWHINGEVYIELSRIYDCARKNYLDPDILFTIVLCHEMAHAIHCKGRDANGALWTGWSTRSGKWFSEKDRNEILEGLAQWYTFFYAIEQDKKRLFGSHWTTMLLLAKVQPQDYRIFIDWLDQRPESIRKAMITARKVTSSTTEPGLDMEGFTASF